MTTTTVHRPSTPDLRRRIHAATDRIGRAWRHTRARIHAPRRSTVTAIECGHCRRWTRPQHYSPRYRACPACARHITDSARAWLHARTTTHP